MDLDEGAVSEPLRVQGGQRAEERERGDPIDLILAEDSAAPGHADAPIRRLTHHVHRLSHRRGGGGETASRSLLDVNAGSQGPLRQMPIGWRPALRMTCGSSIMLSCLLMTSTASITPVVSGLR